MPERLPTLPTTEEQQPPTEDHGERARPILLAAFPKQVAIPLPASGNVVGRAWLAEAGIVDPKVSREHVRFLRRGSRLELEDVGSRGGTFLGGARLPHNVGAPLVDGSILQLGNTLLVYRESFAGSLTPEEPLGELVGPWGLGEVRQRLGTLAIPAVLNVLIEGDTGTGKELLAREVAGRLGRAARFVPINVAAIPHDRFEADLFGWERGAFSGSVRENLGALRGNDKGVIFFDEIEALPLLVQPKLLRFLQFREVFPLGATRPARVDLVVIAATNRPLSEMLAQNAFRRDLSARFNISLSLPSLEARPEDVFAIFEARWRAMRGPLDLAHSRIETDSVALMMRHDWPENVRELERLVMCVDPEIGLKQAVVRQVLGMEAGADLRALTRDVVASALAACGGNQSAASRRLKISRGKLLRLLTDYGLS